jgi:hypothetical protein
MLAFAKVVARNLTSHYMFSMTTPGLVRNNATTYLQSSHNLQLTQLLLIPNLLRHPNHRIQRLQPRHLKPPLPRNANRIP